MFINSAVSRSRLDAAIESGLGSRLRPIWVALRSAGVACCFVSQGGEPFDPLADKPTILTIGDDIWESLRPKAFHCRGDVIVARESIPFAAASIAAGLRFDVVIVETQPEHQADWNNARDAINPSPSYILCSVKPEGRVQ
jgi:hypothetical protein